MMKKMQALVAGSALGAAILAGPAAAAVTGTVAATSEYVFRGITSSDGAAVQGSLDWSDGGLYAGVWGSNTAPLQFDGTEVDLYGGYKFAISEGINIDLGAIYYLFPESEQTPPIALPGVGGFDADYWEVYAGFTAGGFAGKLYYADEFFGDLCQGALGRSCEDSIYVNLSYTFPVKEGLDLAFAVGNQSGDGADDVFGDSVTDYSIKLTKALENGFAASFALMGSDLDVPGVFDDDPKFVVTLSKGFDI
jgi:uncharacterized protein (TIGR02001 family)